MPRDRRPSFATQERQMTIARMYLQQYTLREIGEHMGITRGRVSQILKKIREEWRERRLDDAQEFINRELERIDALERHYWQAWERSLSERRRTKTSKRGEHQFAEITTEQRDGNPEFLNGVARCIERRCKLLGLDAPKVVALDEQPGLAEKILAARRRVRGED